MAECPIATRDITLNLQNRGKAIDKADYGPMDPRQPNDEYWMRMASRWNTTPDEARKMRCGNCGAFDQSPEMLQCIEDGLTEDREADRMEDMVDASDLGYCEIFDFKCAASRTCNAWIVSEEDEEDSEEGEYGPGSSYEEEVDEEGDEG